MDEGTNAEIQPTSSASANEIKTDGDEKIRPIYTCCMCKAQTPGNYAKILRCTHTICDACSTKEVKDDFIMCGSCSFRCRSNEIERHFLIEAIEENNNKNKICQLCDDNLPANYKCHQCEDVLCINCVEAHKRVKVTKTHEIKQLFEVNIATSYCPKHKAQLLYHCKDCDVMTCNNCQLENHYGHSYQMAKDGIEKVRSLIRDGKNTNDERREQLRAFLTKVLQRMKDVDDCKSKLLAEVASSTLVMYQAVDARDARLKETIEKISERKMLKYDGLRSCAEKVNAQLEQLDLFAYITENCQNNLALCKCLTYLNDSFLHAEGAKMNVVSASVLIEEPVEIELTSFKPLVDLLNVVKTYGEIRVKGEEDTSVPTHQSRACSPVGFLDDDVTFLGATVTSDATFGSPKKNSLHLLRLRSGETTAVIPLEATTNGESARQTNEDLSSESRKRRRVSESDDDVRNTGSNDVFENQRSHKFINTYGKPKLTNVNNNGNANLNNLSDSDTSSSSSNNVRLRSLFPPSHQNGDHVELAANDDIADEEKDWEPFCSVCGSEDGDFLKCSAPECTRVFHRYHHVPSYADGHEFSKEEPFVCGFCREPTADATDAKEKRKSTSKTMTSYEHRAAERILLELYCHAESGDLHKIEHEFSQCFQTSNKRMAFDFVRERLKVNSNGVRCAYQKIEAVLADLNQIFINCATLSGHNSSTSVMAEKGVKVGEFYRVLVQKYLPNFVSLVNFS